jgi:hypothetical protein
MDAIAGKDPSGDYWFKSHQSLTNISQADHFFVKSPGLIFWRRRYRLFARMKIPYQYWDGRQHKTDYKRPKRLLGWYRTETLASLALEEAMKTKKIKALVEE